MKNTTIITLTVSQSSNRLKEKSLVYVTASCQSILITWNRMLQIVYVLTFYCSSCSLTGTEIVLLALELMLKLKPTIPDMGQLFTETLQVFGLRMVLGVLLLLLSISHSRISCISINIIHFVNRPLCRWIFRICYADLNFQTHWGYTLRK